MKGIDVTPSKLERLTQDWIAITKEPVTISVIGDAVYAFGTELATLRLLYAYRFSVDTTDAGFSTNLNTFFFRLDL